MLLLIMSAIDIPFGPSGSVTLTCRDDTVVYVNKLGGPKMAMETQRDECVDVRTVYIWLEEMHE